MAKIKSRGWIVGCCVIAAILLITLYFIFDPTNSPFAPKCPFKLLTGIDCPACGNQRSLHSLLHGEILRAIMLNPFLYICLPFLIAIAYATIVDSEKSSRVRAFVFHKYTLYTYIAIFMFWWIFRNTPLWHNLYAMVMA